MVQRLSVDRALHKYVHFASPAHVRYLSFYPALGRHLRVRPVYGRMRRLFFWSNLTNDAHAIVKYWRSFAQDRPQTKLKCKLQHLDPLENSSMFSSIPWFRYQTRFGYPESDYHDRPLFEVHRDKSQWESYCEASCNYIHKPRILLYHISSLSRTNTGLDVSNQPFSTLCLEAKPPETSI